MSSIVPSYDDLINGIADITINEETRIIEPAIIISIPKEMKHPKQEVKPAMVCLSKKVTPIDALPQ